jgi:drug/metabolite transporter (DMT)-like permease
MLALSFGMALYTANDTCVKLIARELPFGEVIFLRGVLSVLFLFIALCVMGQVRSLPNGWSRPVLWRSLFDALGTIAFIAALVRMNFAELAAVVLTSPLILTALAALTLGDRVGWRRWSAIGVGLIGTLFIVKPSAQAFDVWALVALSAAFFSAGRDLATRRIDTGISTLSVSFYGAVAVTLAGAGLGLTESWTVPTAPQWLGITVAAAFLGMGTYFTVLAFREVDIPTVAPFRYTLLFWSALSGYLVFGEAPDRWSFVGAGLIALGGLYALHRENVRHREISARSIPPA